MSIWGSEGTVNSINFLSKIVYDADNNNIVDDSQLLNNQPGSYYLDRANHTNVQPATTVSYDNTISGMVSNDVKLAIDELDSEIDNVKDGTTVVGDANKLDNQDGLYYLDRTNHTGLQIGTTVSFDNIASGMAATEMQGAVDEIDSTLDDIQTGLITVGDSDTLDGQDGLYYLDRVNHTGTQAGTTVTFNNVASGMTATNMQQVGDELDTEIDNIKSGTTIVDNADKLDNQQGAYYLDRANHTGTQAATTVSYDNTISGLTAVNVKLAIDEIASGLGSHGHTKSEISDFTEGDYVHTTGNEAIAGVKTFSNNVIISGNLTVNGTQTFVNSTDMAIVDNEIVLNKDEVGAGISAGTSGIRIERGSLLDARILFDDSIDKWIYGIDGSEVPVGDMEKSVYDTGNNGQVDNADDSDLLEGNNGAYYLDRANHTGSQPSTTISFDNTISGLAAITVKLAIDELAAEKMDISVYDTGATGQVDSSALADNAILLGGQAGAYYLNRANHTGFQAAATITYNNSGSALISTNAQDAFDEIDNLFMRKSIYDTDNNDQVESAALADDSDLLEGENGLYYLSRANHSGTQPATTVSYDNTISGLAATDVKLALDELAAGAGSSTFVGLTDTPANYTSAANKNVRVNAAGNALEFVANADQAEAEVGSENTKLMTALRVSQAIVAQSSPGLLPQQFVQIDPSVSVNVFGKAYSTWAAFDADWHQSALASGVVGGVITIPDDGRAVNYWVGGEVRITGTTYAVTASTNTTITATLVPDSGTVTYDVVLSTSQSPIGIKFTGFNSENIVVRRYNYILGELGTTVFLGNVTSDLIAQPFQANQLNAAIQKCILTNFTGGGADKILTLKSCVVQMGATCTMDSLILTDRCYVVSGNLSAVGTLLSFDTHHFGGTYPVSTVGNPFSTQIYDSYIAGGSWAGGIFENCSMNLGSFLTGFFYFLRGGSINVPIDIGSGDTLNINGTVAGVSAAITINPGGNLTSSTILDPNFSLTLNGSTTLKNGYFDNSGTGIVATDMHNAVSEIDSNRAKTDAGSSSGEMLRWDNVLGKFIIATGLKSTGAGAFFLGGSGGLGNGRFEISNSSGLVTFAHENAVTNLKNASNNDVSLSIPLTGRLRLGTIASPTLYTAPVNDNDLVPKKFIEDRIPVGTTDRNMVHWDSASSKWAEIVGFETFQNASSVQANIGSLGTSKWGNFKVASTFGDSFLNVSGNSSNVFIQSNSASEFPKFTVSGFNVSTRIGMKYDVTDYSLMLGNITSKLSKLSVVDDGRLRLGTSGDLTAYTAPSLDNELTPKKYADLTLKNRIDANFAGSPYTVQSYHKIIFCDCTGGNIVLNLPTIITDQGWQIKVIKTDVTANTATINGNGAETINGIGSQTLTAQYEVKEVASRGAGTDAYLAQ